LVQDASAKTVAMLFVAIYKSYLYQSSTSTAISCTIVLSKISALLQLKGTFYVRVSETHRARLGGIVTFPVIKIVTFPVIKTHEV